MSAVALIVIVLVAVLLMAMLVAGWRRSVTARVAADAGTDFEVEPFRSHAEASRSGEEVS